MNPPGDVTLLLKRWRDGDEGAVEPLFELVYPDLRRIASALVWNPGSEPLLQPTAVVNELYLKLVQLHSMLLEHRAHFFSLAARLMRILVDSARRSGRQKRSGMLVPMHEDLAWIDVRSEEMLDLDRAMEELEKIDKRKCRIVELRFFLGLTAAETAEFLQVSKATVERDYRFTLGWLYQQLRPEADASTNIVTDSNRR